MKENFKKLFAVVLVVAMLAAQMVPALAVNNNPYYCSACEDEAVKGDLLRQILPTCGNVGYDIFACDNDDCAGTITVVVGATGVHTGDENVVPAVAPTCTEDGTKAYELCTGCGAKLEPGTATVIDIKDPKLGHNHIPTVTPADCLNGGFTTYVCSECDDEYVADKRPCLGHDFSIDVPGKAATCKEEGYTAHKKCSRCGEIDPNNNKNIVAIQDHNLHIDVQNSLAPTCTTDGYNLFVCNNDRCPYYEGNGGVREPKEKLGHTLTATAAVAATCTEAGKHAYWTCSVCDGIFKNEAATEAFANLAETEIPALGHKEIAVAYKAPTCSEKGAKDGIVCVTCGDVLVTSVEIPANGHTLTDVAAVDSTCDTQGNIAHKKCTVCNKLFAAATPNDATNAGATPLAANAEKLPKRAHVTVDREALAPTCTTTGLTVTTCTYDDCNYAVSAEVAALGHTFTHHDYVAPTCEDEGKLAYNECTVCNLLFADGANSADITIEPVDEATLIEEALGHTEIEVPFKAPTYNEAGHEAGTKCSVCDESLVAAQDIPELKEAIKFSYELTGVREDAEIAVNSGSVTMKIFFEVLADADDNEEWKSDVLANIFGIDFAVGFDNDAFALVSVDDVNVPFAGNFSSTPKDTANDNAAVIISQNADKAAGVAFKETDGKILLTTLVFNVLDDTAAANYQFDFDWTVTHPEDDHVNGIYNVDTSASAISAEIEVRKLGDANYSDSFSQADMLKITQYIEEALMSETPVDYIAEYDMNKDGYIDGVDLNLLRRAIVGDNAYLG